MQKVCRSDMQGTQSRQFTQRVKDEGLKTKKGVMVGMGVSQGTLPAIEYPKSIAGVTERCTACSQYGIRSHLNPFSVEYKLQSTH